MNSKQGSRYIKKRMGNELKNKILEYDGIITSEGEEKKPVVSTCPKCDLTNAFENKYCSKCSYPLKPEAYDEIKQSKEARFREQEQKYNQKLEELRNTMENRFDTL